MKEDLTRRCCTAPRLRQAHRPPGSPTVVSVAGEAEPKREVTASCRCSGSAEGPYGDEGIHNRNGSGG